MTNCLLRDLAALLAAAALWANPVSLQKPVEKPREELLLNNAEIGRYGGQLVVSLRSEPKTLNPVTMTDNPSKEVIWRMMADLVHINRFTQQTEPALAKSWKVSPDGLRYTLKLRRGLRFSDGHPLEADDVLFSFRLYLDEKVHAPQRDLLIVGGKPIVVGKLDSETLVFELAQPYGVGDRLFDGFAILPRHLLQKAYSEGTLAQAWSLTTPPEQIAGLGPFRLKQYVPGQRLVLERNPYYWKADRKGNRLPYLDELVFLIVPSEDAQVIRFQAGDTDVISRLNAENYAVLERQQQARGYTMSDIGPRSLDRARELLRAAGFSWKADGTLMDAGGEVVEFSIVSSASNAERTRMATIIQDDLKQLGMSVHVVPLEFRALLARILDSRDYEACVLGLASGDGDPNGDMNVWLSSGPQHLWNPGQAQPATPWEAEIDRLMQAQLTARKYSERKRLYDRVQQIVAENQPMIFLVSPHLLVGAKNGLGNFRPAVLDHYTLWNVEELFWRGK